MTIKNLFKENLICLSKKIHKVRTLKNISSIFNKEYSLIKIILLISAILTLYNYKTFADLFIKYLNETSILKSILYIISDVSLVFGFSILALSLLSFNKWIFKFWAGFLFICSSIGKYFVNTYGVVIDRQMIENVFNTDGGEAGELMSLKIMLNIIIFGILPATSVLFLNFKKNKNIKKKVKKISTVLALITLIFLYSVKLDYIHYRKFTKEETPRLVPVNFIVSTTDYARRRIKHRNIEKKDTTANFYLNGQLNDKEPLNIIVIIGESARANNFQLNGYSKATTPKLSQEKNLFNFSNVNSCATSTSKAIPCIFSRKDRKEFKMPLREVTLVKIMSHLNFETSWYSVQNKGYEVCKEANECVFSVDKKDKDIHDEVLLEYLDKKLIKDNKKNNFIVLHTNGSHQRYHLRYPKEYELFTPACHSDVYECSYNELVNSYDNSIYYTDNFIANIIDSVRDKNAIVFYTSDHGESLGEDGIYTHASPYMIAPEYQTKVPFIIWTSDTFVKNNPDRITNLQKTLNKEINHGYLFHSVMDLIGAESELIEKDKSIF